MDLQNRVVSDMKRRSALLPREVDNWYEKAEKNIDDLGIHRSQFYALRIMMDTLLTRQNELLNQFSPSLSTQQFSEAYADLTTEIIGTNNLWSFFRVIMDQHQHPDFGCTLVAADLIAAN